MRSLGIEEDFGDLETDMIEKMRAQIITFMLE